MPSQTSERSFHKSPVDPVDPAPATSCPPATSCRLLDEDDDDEDEDFCNQQTGDLLEETSHQPLHDAVQPAISVPQRSPVHLALSTIVTPLPVAEVAEEVEVVTQPDVSFKSLIKLPVRERPTTSRQRVKPPSYNLTSNDRFAFIKE